MSAFLVAGEVACALWSLERTEEERGDVGRGDVDPLVEELAGLVQEGTVDEEEGEERVGGETVGVDALRGVRIVAAAGKEMSCRRGRGEGRKEANLS